MKSINFNNQDLEMYDSDAIEHALKLAEQNQDIYIQSLENLRKTVMQITDVLISEIIDADFSVMQNALDELFTSITDYNTNLVELAFAAIENFYLDFNVSDIVELGKKAIGNFDLDFNVSDVVELGKKAIGNYEPLVEKAVDSMPIEAHTKSKLLEYVLNDFRNQPVAIMLSLLAIIISLISNFGDCNDSDKKAINININIDCVDQLVVVRDELEDTIQELLQIGSSEDH